MAVLPIRITGDPVLHARANDVDEIDESLYALVHDMEDTMSQAPGVGLAAPQVGVPLRLFVYNWRDEDGELHRGTAINPQLLVSPPPLGDADPEEDSEGCLSIPGERFPLLRSHTALLRAVELDGTPYEVLATGWLARIFQHEFDHLDGVLYADRLPDAHHRAAQRVVRRRKWGVPGNSWLPGRDHLDD
ncbi:peptide deformylase [Homoserinibacter sp. GY 40078]|uniref:peptide deformylase n=1 Tax=Homoserinibacter sp. GY 40078 TaxID=2603275 RepID=UPI0011C8B4ED|nr:peptide deformylase [Homoserinibacter sp. GY 40078]TXK17374.1 peptide deformylase [Homoserinibacter sp. GY 40078]